jgi:small-conductance mechanosensitive channel
VRFLVLFLISLFLLGLPPSAARADAQTLSPAADPDAVIARAKQDLHAIGVGAQGLEDAEIETRLAAIPPIQARLVSLLNVLTPRLRDIEARLAQLGSPPAAGALAEDPVTAQTRRDIGAALSRVNGEVQSARLLSLTADQIAAALSDRLRENFSARLWSRTRSVLDPGLWRDFAAALPDDAARIARSTAAEFAEADIGSRITHNLAALVAALATSLALLGPARVILNGLGYRRAARSTSLPRLRRIVLALWLMTVAAGTPLCAGLLLRAALARADLLTPTVDRLSSMLIQAVVFAAFLEGLGRAILSPGRSEWRLAPVSPDMVARLAPFPGLLGITAALSGFVAGLGSILGVSLASRVASDCVTVLIELAAMGGALTAVGRARVAHRAQTPAAPSATEDVSRLPWILATLAAWLALVASLIAVLVGYLALASFVMRETVWIAAILVLLFLLLALVDDLFPALLSPKAPLGGALQTALGVTEGAMEQTGVLLSGVARLLLLLIAWVAMLAPFGASAEDILRRFTATDFVVRLGLVSISPGVVLGGLTLFVVGLSMTRAVRRWLEVRYLPKTDLDMGLQTSLATGITYLGALIALMVAFAYLGLSIAQIALFASALSVGIGFGLQGIIGNFVSGLVLLAERPVRVGDWVAIGDLEGDVRKISMRATEIEMLDRSRLIVPNSELVSKTVRNLTHAGALGRLQLVLKLAWSAAPEAVRDLLLARLRAHPQVLEDPPPAVYMTDARDGAVEFTAFAYLISPRLVYGVRSELLFQIVPDLAAAGFELAQATTVVNVDLAERPIGPSAAH